MLKQILVEFGNYLILDDQLPLEHNPTEDKNPDP